MGTQNKIISSVHQSKNLCYVQKKNGNYSEFKFSDDKLIFSDKDSVSSRTFSIDYDEISFETSEFLERNNWLRNASYFWMLLGAVISVHSYIQTAKPILSIWLIIGGICYIVFRARQTRFTIFETKKGNILIIHNDQHDIIKMEIEQRRNHYLKKQYAWINPENSIDNELSKFKWLLDHDVISREEYDELCVKLKLGI